MSTPYSEVDDIFLSNIKDKTFLDFEEDDRNIILDGIRIQAINKFKQCKLNLKDRNETERVFNDDLTEEIKVIIGTIMVRFWMNDKIFDLDLLKQRMSTKDWKLSSQSEHLDKLIKLKKDLDAEVNTLINEYINYNYSLDDLK
jgi:hypothetical protein